jgi:hypothetical protein
LVVVVVVVGNLPVRAAVQQRPDPVSVEVLVVTPDAVDVLAFLSG